MGVNGTVNLCLNSLPSITFNSSINWWWFITLQVYTKWFHHCTPDIDFASENWAKIFQCVSRRECSNKGNIVLSIQMFYLTQLEHHVLSYNLFFLSSWNSSFTFDRCKRFKIIPWIWFLGWKLIFLHKWKYFATKYILSVNWAVSLINHMNWWPLSWDLSQ